MNNELLLSIKKYTDTLIEQRKTKPQDTLQYILIKQMEAFSSSTPKKLVEEGEWLLPVTSFETTNSFFNITDENKSFSISIPGSWSFRKGLETVNKLQQIVKLRSGNDIEIHVEVVRKRGKQIKEDSE